MVKFNLDFKIKIVTEYISGCGSTVIWTWKYRYFWSRNKWHVSTSLL